MTREQLLRKFPNASESFIRQNVSPVGAVQPDERKRRARGPLDKGPRRKQTSETSVGVVITLIACRSLLYDSDNAISGGLKALRDAIAASLGIDDGDKRLRWHYGQCQTTGENGVIVKIERLCASQS